MDFVMIQHQLKRVRVDSPGQTPDTAPDSRKPWHKRTLRCPTAATGGGGRTRDAAARRNASPRQTGPVGDDGKSTIENRNSKMPPSIPAKAAPKTPRP